MVKPTKSRIIIGLALAYLIVGFILTHMPLSPAQKEFVEKWDKPMHFTMFMGVGLTLAILSRLLPVRSWPRVALTLGAGLFIAVSDEVLQMATPGRTVDRYDLVANVCGLTTGIVLLETIAVLRNQWTTKRDARRAA